jgi:hypothetical protein
MDEVNRADISEQRRSGASGPSRRTDRRSLARSRHRGLVVTARLVLEHDREQEVAVIDAVAAAFGVAAWR